MNGHMAYAFSLWGPSGTDWLDGGRCQREYSCDSSAWEITNLQFTTSSSFESSKISQNQDQNLSFEDERYATLVAKLYAANLSYTDIEELVRQGPEKMSRQKMNKVGRHCEQGGNDAGDCDRMANWLRFNQF